MAVGWHFKALLFRSAIYGRRDNLTMPMDQFRRVRVIEQLHGHRDALMKADERSGNCSVISDGADGVLFGNIRQHGTDAQCDVSGATGCGPFGPRSACPSARSAVAPA